MDITYSVSILTSLMSAIVTRMPLNNAQSGYKTGMPTQLMVELDLRHALESTSSILLQFPQAAQVTIVPTADAALSCYQTDQTGKQLNMLLCEVNKTAKSILVRNYCQVTSCGKRDIVRIQLMETFVQNYAAIVNPLVSARDSIVITTTTREGVYYLDTGMANVEPEMIPNGMIMPSPEILRTNNVINKKVAWVFSFKTNKN